MPNIDKVKLEKFFVTAKVLMLTLDESEFDEDYILCLNTLRSIIETDDKPYDGLIGKLIEKSGLPRFVITRFIRILRLHSHDFTGDNGAGMLVLA